MKGSDRLREKLVEACHVLADEGQGDLIWGHVSVRGGERSESLIMKPAGFGLEEIHDEHLIAVDLDGHKTDGAYPLHVEVFIHTQIMRARSDVQAVVHTHPPHAVAFSSLDRPLAAVGHEGALFCDGLPVFDETTDLIVTPAQGEAVAACLGPRGALLLRNHGIVTVGRSVEEAVMTAIILEKACWLQLLAEAAGGPRVVSNAAEARAKRDRLYRPQAFEQAFRYCVRRLQSRPPLCCRRAAGIAGHGSRP